MSGINLRLLGPPTVELDDTLTAVKPRKALAILVYLACEGRRQSRDTLATLLWPESGQSQARASLRRRLSELDRTLGSERLQADREFISLSDAPDLSVDVAEFEAHLAETATHGHDAREVCPECREPLETAAALYTGDFLTGFTLQDCPEFDDWQFFKAEELRLALSDALQKLITLHNMLEEYASALPHARRWLSLDPLHEPAHQELMRLYARTGQHSAALRQYQLCVDILDAEMGMPVSEETAKLHEAIVNRQLDTAPTAGDTAGASGRNTETDTADTTQQLDTPVAEEDELRVITVLAADLNLSLEGNWDTNQADTAEKLSRLIQNVPDLLAPYDAHINRSFGGGFQALFGLSQIHEDDPERAIHAALDIQSAAEKASLEITVGVNTGVAYVSRSGADISTTGSSVTLASRLQSLAGAGEILAGESTYRQTRGAIRYTPYEGTRGTSGLYRVEGLRRDARKARGIEGIRSGLVGREEELTKLQTALTKAQEGEGQIASLIAEAGVGKSRLVSELRTSGPLESNTAAVVWLEGRCLEMTTATAYAPFIDILHGFFGWGPEDPHAARAKMIVDTLDEIAAQGALLPDQVAVIGPVLGNLLSIQFGNEWDEWVTSTSPEHVRFQTFQTLADFLMALVRDQPMVLVLEDLHWADTLSIDLVAFLMEKLDGASLMLLCTSRPEREHRSWQLTTIASHTCPDRFTELNLRELTRNQVQELLERLLGSETVSPAVQEMIYEQCHGNPYYLEEILHALIDSGVLVNTGHKWVLPATLSDLQAPASVHSVTLSRYDRLSPQEKETLQRAAVLGRRFDRSLLDEMVGDATDVVDETLEALEDRAFVYLERTMPEEIYAFRHVLAQQAVYQTLPPARRIALHGQAGAALERRHHHSPEEAVELLAYHFARSDQDDKAVVYLLRAAEKSRRAYLTGEAVSDYERALQRIDALDYEEPAKVRQLTEWRLTAQVGLGQIYSWIAKYALAEDCFRQAIKLATSLNRPARELARLHFWLGEILNWQDKQEESIDLSLEALSILGDDTECAEAAMINAALAWSYLAVPDPAGYREYALRNDSFIEDVPYSEEMRSVYTCVIDAHYSSKHEFRALQLSDLYREKSQQIHDLWGMAEMHLTRSRHLKYLKGDYEHALHHIQQASVLFQRVGDRIRESYMSDLSGLLALYAGNLVLAGRYLSTALETLQSTSHELTRIVTHDVTLLRLAQHRWQEAQEILQTILFTEFIPVETDVLVGRIHLAQGQRKLARETLLRALDAMLVDDLDARMRLWSMVGWRPLLVDALSALEEAVDDRAEFAHFCSRYRGARPELADTLFQQWHLMQGVPDARFSRTDYANSPLAKGTIAADEPWTWHDPYADCSYTEDDGGVTIHPAILRDLWFLNRSAPRLLRPVSGAFAVQTTCGPAYVDRPAIGGILIWQDEENYLRLGIGIRAPHEVSLEGCIDNRDIVFGRGMLHTDRTLLRLERTGDRIRSLCSADGDTWFTTGECEFPATDEVQVGVHAIGNIDRTIYYGAFAEGTAIRFEDFVIMSRD